MISMSNVKLCSVQEQVYCYFQNNIHRYDNDDDDDVCWEINMERDKMRSGQSQVQFSVPHLLLLFLCECSSVMK